MLLDSGQLVSEPISSEAEMTIEKVEKLDLRIIKEIPPVKE